ncbi:MAG: putative transposase [Arcticibacterium sp.]|jgi:putative transposase
MPNTYTQIPLQFVFAIKNRMALIDKSRKDELHKYITGIFQNQDHKILQINSMPDHIHILVGFRPVYSISEVVQKVKSESTKWINEKGFCKHKFA